MPTALTRPLIAATFALASAGALAHGGQFDSYSAEKTTAFEGETVRFDVAWSLFAASDYRVGGGDTPEPEPAEGSQSWLRNWYDYRFETLRSFQVTTNLFTNDAVSSDLSLGSGQSSSTSWSFYAFFPTAGTYDVTVNGVYRVAFASESGAEEGTRECSRVDVDDPNSALSCTSWYYNYPQTSDNFEESFGFGPATIRVEVSPVVVPEPGAWALLLGGLAAVGAAVRRHR